MGIVLTLILELDSSLDASSRTITPVHSCLRWHATNESVGMASHNTGMCIMVEVATPGT